VLRAQRLVPSVTAAGAVRPHRFARLWIAGGRATACICAMWRKPMPGISWRQSGRFRHRSKDSRNTPWRFTNRHGLPGERW